MLLSAGLEFSTLTDRLIRSKLPHPLHTALCISQVTDIEFVSVRVIVGPRVLYNYYIFVYYRVVIFLIMCNSNSGYLEKKKSTLPQ